MATKNYRENVGIIEKELSMVLSRIDERQIDEYISTLLQAEKVFFVGVGRVLLALEMTVKRLNHLGINACVVGAVNEPPIGPKDILVVGSGSGESIFPKHITACAKRYDAKIVHLTSSPTSSIAQLADVIVDFHCGSKGGKGEYISIQPMTTLFEQSLVLFGDLVCLEIMAIKQLSLANVKLNHANLE
ncbi:3-hexulose-6-phosphate isomerase [Salmonella enterica subsp. enterica serovar Tchad]|nr:3-hexulose-6-phosphate isomerase [Salmonella enterica subsp. enterica serovar Tchad]ECO5914151.1 SIS domain-containing protein [Salmonella enterica]EGB5697212.1 SIS domain-containing protein [Salmonella enterica subsp. enterica]EHW4467587.1 SIS domain-containing protein [Salmonella enterica subsp. enterica serovar Kottbus]ECA0363384.1 SIS domain-containing protein [Salmonella enterica subsp. enterica serovar Tchad]